MGVAAKVEKGTVVSLACLETMCYGGVIFGWPSLVFVLKDLGYYGEACQQQDENVTTPLTTSVPTNTYSTELKGNYRY